ncbi:MAG: tRNA dihydrouridine(20/20a) synthase DusA [Rhodospirillaceae bacterium]|nr:tRNA dihydrouridine(20/20a) synthase DusA [Rhodospirillaceae bacterium]
MNARHHARMTISDLRAQSDAGLRAAPDRRLAVAPMMDCTDRFDRYFLRQISAQVLLYTEMVTTGAILNGNRDRYLRLDPVEHPVALQLGGADAAALAACARIGEDFGYDEINLNVGCPSDRVRSGRFGACLMAEPDLVADCVRAMQDLVSIPVTVKCRIGIDDRADYAFLEEFVGTIRDAGCKTVILHARMAVLSGLTPKQNREIPPLRHAVAARVKNDFPDLAVILNGGVATLEQAVAHLARFDGVMVGRAAYHTPWMLADADARIFGAAQTCRSRDEIVRAMLPYVERQVSTGVPLQRITRHMLGLFHGRPGSRAWRRYLSENAHHASAGPEILEKALAFTASDRRVTA